MGGGGSGVGWWCVACRIIVSAVCPSPSPFPLDLGFRIWDIYLGLGFGIGLGLDSCNTYELLSLIFVIAKVES